MILIALAIVGAASLAQAGTVRLSSEDVASCTNEGTGYAARAKLVLKNAIEGVTTFHTSDAWGCTELMNAPASEPIEFTVTVREREDSLGKSHVVWLRSEWRLWRAVRK